jgi:hypothetical protein
MYFSCISILTLFPRDLNMDLQRKGLHMPDELVALVQDFLHNRTRRDWRSCKAAEARAIKLLCRDEPRVVANQIGPEFWELILSQSLYELITRYPAGTVSEEGATIRLKRVWRA